MIEILQTTYDGLAILGVIYAVGLAFGLGVAVGFRYVFRKHL